MLAFIASKYNVLNFEKANKTIQAFPEVLKAILELLILILEDFAYLLARTTKWIFLCPQRGYRPRKSTLFESTHFGRP